MTTFEAYSDRDMLIMALAKRLAGDLGEALRMGDRASFVVPGGSTPGPVFDALAGVDLDWARVTVIPSDERWVPESDPRSNAGIIKARLLRGKAAAARFQSLYTGGEGEAAIADLSAAIDGFLPFSVVLLGMGADFHTASLFPGSSALRPDQRRAGQANLHFVKTPGLEPIVPRMTLTVPALNMTERKHVMITGADKRAAWDEAVRINDPYQAPIIAVASGATVHWSE